MTDLTRLFLKSMPRNMLRVFSGRNALWHILAICATLLIVISGCDWIYFGATRPFAGYLFPAVILGWYAPIVFLVASYIVGLVRKDQRAIFSAYSAAQAAVIGLVIAALYKAFTGRPGPGHYVGTLIDTSREFHFGFLKGGVYYGWPSSHTTVAFAMSSAVVMLYPSSKVMQGIVILYAVYIGMGVSMTIHWFSDVVAGAIIGSVIGVTVGNVFKEQLIRPKK